MDPLVKQEYVVTTKYEKKISEHTTNIHLTRRLMLYIIYVNKLNIKKTRDSIISSSIKLHPVTKILHPANVWHTDKTTRFHYPH